jgi:hypothetical protein
MSNYFKVFLIHEIDFKISRYVYQYIENNNVWKNSLNVRYAKLCVVTIVLVHISMISLFFLHVMHWLVHLMSLIVVPYERGLIAIVEYAFLLEITILSL